MPEPAAKNTGKAMQKAPPPAKEENPLIVKFRDELLKRNVAGIKSIGMTFRQCDDNHSGTLTVQEFKDGLLGHNIRMKDSEMNELFKVF
jgi:hypothetical protein